MPASASFSSWFSSWGAGKMRFSTPTSLASASAAQEAASERRRLPAKRSRVLQAVAMNSCTGPRAIASRWSINPPVEPQYTKALELCQS
jgi:hypothetical protein